MGEPTLEETLEWSEGKIGSETAQYKSGEVMCLYANRGARLSPSGFSLVLRWKQTHDNGAIMEEETRISGKWRDVLLTGVIPVCLHTNPIRIIMYKVRLLCRNNRACININESKCPRRTSEGDVYTTTGSLVPRDDVPLWFQSQSMDERAAKALEHVLKLCGA